MIVSDHHPGSSVKFLVSVKIIWKRHDEKLLEKKLKLMVHALTRPDRFTSVADYLYIGRACMHWIP